jgi:mitochondrial fission protein ELM1
LTDSTQIWAISDGRAGNARQALALASALTAGTAGTVRACTLQARAPWRWLAPRGLAGAAHAFGAEFNDALRAPPAIAIGCGRQAALATRLLRARGTRVVQILDPRIDPAHWDLVVAPEHDGLSGAHVVSMLGSVHPVDDAWLAEAHTRFAAFAAFPQPRTALLIGGPSAHARFDRTAFDALAVQLDAAIARDGGSVLATASRRTPGDLRDALKQRYATTPGLAWCGDTDGENPYAGLLAWADRIACTPDSVNMISEACATRVPVHVFDPARVGGRPRRFLDALLARGRIRALDDVLAPFDVEPLRETARVAREIRARL